MDEEDIKSPLPPRRFSSLYQPEQTETTVTNPVINVQPAPAVVTPPQPVTGTTSSIKKGGLGKAPIYAGILIFLVIILFLVFKVILPGLSKDGGQKIIINYWGLWEDTSVINGVIADYEAKNPKVKINYIRNEKTNYKSRLQTRLETAPTATDNPDIFRVHVSWLPMFKGDLAKVPADVATKIGLDTDYFETYKTTIKSGGSWLAVPLMYDGLSLFYNKDLIDSAQVNLPKSWWDLEMAANKLTVRDAAGNIKVAGAALGLVDNVDHWSDILGLMLKQGGVDVLAGDADNDKKLQDVLTFYTLFRTKDRVWDETLPSSTEMFANGKLAFYFAPSWRVFNIEDTKIPTLRYDVTAVPQLPTSTDLPLGESSDSTALTNIQWGSYWVEGVNPKSKNQSEAWKFLAYLSTPANLEKFYAAAAQTRSFGEIYPRKSMVNMTADNSKIKPYTDAANSASSWYLSSRTFDEGLNDEMAKYFGDAINSMVQTNMTPDQVLPNLRSGINQLVSKYGLK